MSKRSTRGERAGVTTEMVHRIAFALPGVEAGTSYGFPSLKLGGKFLARLRDHDEVLVVMIGSIDDRDYLLSHHPDVFFTTDHYRNYATVLIRLAKARESMVREVLTDAWRRGAPKRVVAEFDARGTASDD